MTTTPKTLPELQPCHFCEHSIMRMRDVGQMQQARCDGCGAAGPLFTEPRPAIDAWNALAALSQHLAVAAIPPGMALVPIEPTDEMCRAALDCQDHDPEDPPESEMYCLYQAMVKAAPQPPEGQQDRPELSMSMFASKADYDAAVASVGK